MRAEVLLLQQRLSMVGGLLQAAQQAITTHFGLPSQTTTEPPPSDEDPNKQRQRLSAQNVIDAFSPIITIVSDIQPLVRMLSEIDRVVLTTVLAHARQEAIGPSASVPVVPIDVGPTARGLKDLLTALNVDQPLWDAWTEGLFDGAEEGSLLFLAESNIDIARQTVPQCRDLLARLSEMLDTIVETIPGWQNTDTGTSALS